MVSLIVVIAVGALACGAYINTTPLNTAPRPLVPRSAETVEVFASGSPSEPFVDIALLQVTHYDAFTRQGLAYAIQRLREQAGQLGCDALFIKGVTENYDNDPGTRQVSASCLVYTHQQQIGQR